MNRHYLAAWLCWLAGFVILEWAAVRDRARGDTLSELVWSVLAVHPLLWILFALFSAWIVIHFLSGGRVG